jgi:hypothetical protein
VYPSVSKGRSLWWVFPHFLPKQKMGRRRQSSYFYRKTFGKMYCPSQSSVGFADSSFAKEPYRLRAGRVIGRETPLVSSERASSKKISELVAKVHFAASPFQIS